MKTIAKLLLGIAFLLLSTLCASAAGEAVYVWSFTDRSLQKNDLTDKFTNDFETALAKDGSYRIVERRQIDQLLAQAENEKTITDVGQFSDDFLKALKAKRADMVVFGTVFDDLDSGQYNITVTFEDFTGEKKLIKSCLLPRGRVNDAESRMAAMESMVRNISERTASVVETNSRDLLFQLTGCTIANDTVSFHFLLTNNGEDNKFCFKGGWREHDKQPKAWDNFGNTGLCSRISVSNHFGEDGVCETMITGVPVKCEWQIAGLSAKATSIPRLDIWYHDERLDADILVTFRNIRIQR